MIERRRLRIALIGPAHPYKGGGARHTTELAHRLAAAGHDVVIESWRAMYPAALYPGVQTVEVAEGEPFARTRRLLSWRRPDGWLRAGRRLRDRDLAVFTFLAPAAVPAYLGIIRGIGRRPAGAGPTVVVICHNVLPHERRPGDVALTRALLRRADGILTHTERLARAARALAPGTPVWVAGLPPHLPQAAPQAARPGSAQGDTAPSGDTPGPDGPQPPDAAQTARRAGVVRAAPARGGTAPSGDTPDPDGPQPPDAVQTARRAAAVKTVSARGDDPPEPPDAAQTARRAAAVKDQAVEPAPAREAPLRLLFFGIVRPYKGLDVLLRALARAGGAPARTAPASTAPASTAPAGPGFTLTVAGEFWSGPGATRALVAALGLGDRVEVRPGYVPAAEIGALLRRADALVLPYRHGTASQNAWLAFSHGVPVIATRTGTFAEQIRDGVDGLLCDPGDEASLAAALARFGEPGVAAKLRRGVRPVDPAGLWEAYLDALLAAATPGTPPTAVRK